MNLVAIYVAVFESNFSTAYDLICHVRLQFHCNMLLRIRLKKEAVVHVMAWRQTSDTPLSEPMLTHLTPNGLTRLHGTQWRKSLEWNIERNKHGHSRSPYKLWTTYGLCLCLPIDVKMFALSTARLKITQYKGFTESHTTSAFITMTTRYWSQGFIKKQGKY